MSYVEENAAARDRVLSLVARLTDAQMALPLADGWTIGAELAHLAFWDRVHTGRLRAALQAGGDLPAPLSLESTDALNDAGLPGWRSIAGATAISLFAEASSEVDEYLASLTPEIVERIRSAGIPRHVERYRHRTEHGDTIEAALGRLVATE